MINNQTRFLSFPDGTIQFIRRGLPPDELQGYEVDPGDMYTFHPILPPCAARVFKNLNDSGCCPASQHVRHCTKYGYYMMTADCCKTCFQENRHVPLGMEKLKSGTDT